VDAQFRAEVAGYQSKKPGGISNHPVIEHCEVTRTLLAPRKDLSPLQKFQKL
jgi:hypothetical protein